MAATRDSTARSACFLCDEVSDTVIWQEDGIDGLLCRCGMVYTNQFTSPERSDPTHEFHLDHFYALPASFKGKWVAQHCPRGRLVEIGCGEGFFLEAVRSHGFDVLGLEPNCAYSPQLRKRNLQVVHEFVEENSLPKHHFDVVYHCDLLAHFPDPIRSLRAMSELLNPDGVLCFEIGLLGDLSPYWYSLVGRIGLGQHRWLYSDRAFKNLMRKAGLDVRVIQYFGLAPEVLGGKLLGVAHKRLVAPVLHNASPGAKEWALNANRSFRNFLRYRVGTLVPHIGPQTLFVVARPVHVQ